jgi:hypothetical protein
MTETITCGGSGAVHMGDPGDDHGYCFRCGKTWPLVTTHGLLVLVTHTSEPLRRVLQEWDVILYLCKLDDNGERTGETVAVPYGRAVSGTNLMHALSGAMLSHTPRDPYGPVVHSVVVMPTGGQAAKEAAVAHYTKVRDALRKADPVRFVGPT